MASGGGGNIKVVVRVRPFNGRELDRNAKCVVRMDSSQTILTPPASSDARPKNNKAALEGVKTFAFDKSYWSFDRQSANFAGQDDLFADLGNPLLDNAFQGYNNCIFAYGQTGSGKSYSMMGYGVEEGVIPKICRDMFERIDEIQADKNLKCTVEVSYLEIYNERVRDLLNPSTKGNLKVREHPSTGPYVEDLAKLVVRSFAEIENLMDEGNKARTVAATNMNETSSRSHAVFTLTLTQKRHDAETGMDTEKVAKISLVDLAGSERATSTGATGARLREGAEINRSLSTLGRVIAALADLSSGKKKNASVVPYRDSVLTWLLKDSLGGNSLTAMIAAISPADINFEETLSTLRYADSAKRIKNHAVVNEDPNARMIRELKEELAQLRSKLSSNTTSTNANGDATEQSYPSSTPLSQQFVSLTKPDGTAQRVSKAQIAEQLSQSEKLYSDLNQTWEQKLQKTEQIHKEREAALEELGISIEKGFIGLSTPKKMPHLVNLSDDPLLAECLVYNLKPGTTTVGNVEVAEETASAEIRLNGSKILPEHCTFENIDGVVTVVPKTDAAVMVNGIRIEQSKRLRSGYRIILGDFHIFRFNHPQEARAERAEQAPAPMSSLRHAIAASELGSLYARPGYERRLSDISRTGSEALTNGDASTPRSQSPAPFRRQGRDSDWALARREAVSAILGPDQKMSGLTDDELDALFDDLQRVRAVRKGRPESRMYEDHGIGDQDDDDSVSSFPVREKYMSSGTLDNFSLDTAITVPSTPLHGEEDDRLQLIREEMQRELEKQKGEYEQQLISKEEGSAEIDDIRAEKARMEQSLRNAKEEMQKQLQEQKEDFERQMQELLQPRAQEENGDRDASGMTERQRKYANHVISHWRCQKYVSMAGAILQNASVLKEAQVMSQQMDKNVVFQYTVVDVGHTLGSSYDLVLNGQSADDDVDLDVAQKPCIAIRVVDFKNSIVHIWSLEKLHVRLRIMRQMYQYLDRPEYIRHFRLENPFSESCQPVYSRIGDVDIPLAAVFQCRVQDFSLDVFSPYTSSVIGIIRLSLEPSSAEAPPSTLKFNVVMQDLVGFPEREGTDVHAQLFVPDMPEEGGATTTQIIRNFDEGPVRFESVHSMSLPLSSPHDASLRVSIFARVTAMHLDKLLSWDDMRDSAGVRPTMKRQHSRIAETEYYSEERYDIFARVQVFEIGEDGDYAPVEVVQANVLDAGAYQLHQGLQRRVVLNLTHSSGQALPWQEVANLRVGNIHLVDPSGRILELGDQQPEVLLTLVSPPVIRNSPDGTTNVKLIVQWDSSVHGSLLLDRPMAEKHRVQLSLCWDIVSPRLANPMTFTFVMTAQIRSRAYIRQTSMLMQLWNNTRVVHSTTGNFSVSIKPSIAKHTNDLWRMDTRQEYVKGEEMLSGWAPRTVSLLSDYVACRKRRRRITEIEMTKGLLSPLALSMDEEDRNSGDTPLDSRQESLLHRTLDLWQRGLKTVEPLSKQQLRPPRDGAVFASTAPQYTNGTNCTSKPTPVLNAVLNFLPKNPTLLKAGYLLTPDPTSAHWVRRFVELRRPYLHIYSPDGDELNAINLTNSRVDCEPQVAKLLNRDDDHKVGYMEKRLCVFAVYATSRAWLFAAAREREKSEWVWGIDRSFFASGEGTPEDEDMM
ncbi:hypothetical protein LTR66_002397 [Elasticomyces elasticus]|nr:hypothetical protein LTR66_002397 [Elasticomyces elasticus]